MIKGNQGSLRRTNAKGEGRRQAGNEDGRIGIQVRGPKSAAKCLMRYWPFSLHAHVLLFSPFSLFC